LPAIGEDRDHNACNLPSYQLIDNPDDRSCAGDKSVCGNVYSVPYKFCTAILRLWNVAWQE
jgi:hypothetical protein